MSKDPAIAAQDVNSYLAGGIKLQLELVALHGLEGDLDRSH